MPQIPSYPEKTLLADDDVFVIADSAAGNATKKVKASTVWKTDAIEEKTPAAGMNIKTAGGVITIGEGVPATGTLQCKINSATGQFRLYGGNGGVKLHMDFDASNDVFSYGDMGAEGNATVATLTDGSKTFDVSSGTSDALYSCNGIPGFTGTVAPVNSITVVGGIVTAVS